MMRTKFSIIIDVLMVDTFSCRAVFIAHSTKTYTHQHHIITPFLFSESAMQIAQILFAFYILSLRLRLPFSIFIITSEFSIAN